MVLKSILLSAKPEQQLPITLSVSKVKTFKDCPAKYRFCYIEKLPRKDWSFHTFGKFIHEILENFYRSKIEGSTDPHNIIMGQSLKNAFGNFKEKLTAEQVQETKSILSGYLKQLQDQGDEAPTILTVEKSFYVDIDGKILLNGFIDRTQLDRDGVLHVSDYKTTKNKRYLKNDYFQLLTYAFVMCLEDPNIKKVRTSYILLRHNFETIVKEFDRDEIMEVEKLFLDWADKINDEKLYRPKPTPLCGYCDYLSFCDIGQRSMGDRAPMDSVKFGETKW